MSAVKFIAPNGARVICTDWNTKVFGNADTPKWRTEVLMHIIFADPLLAA
jgi:hypothetical protein